MTRAKQQIEKLANFIMSEIPGEPSQSEGAIDCAIRIMREGMERGDKPHRSSTM